MQPTFVTSMLIGFVIAAPIGPASLLCIRRTLTRGRRAGLIASAGAALADALAAAVSVLGVSLVSETLARHARVLQLAFGAALILAGVSAYRRTSSPASPASARGRDLSAAAGVFALTIGNPGTLLAFVAAFGAIGLSGGWPMAVWAAVGVFCGASLWWLLLCTAAGALGSRFTALTLRLDRATGFLIALLGVVAIASALAAGAAPTG